MGKITGLIKKHGFIGLAIKFIEKKTDRTDSYYRAHAKEYVPDGEELDAQRESWRDFPDCPKISIVVPAYRTPENFLTELLASVAAQTYENWELCIADGSCDGGASVGKIVKKYAEADSRILYKRLEENGGISNNTNAALAMATGEYIAFLDHDDLLSPNALYEMAAGINEAKVRPMLLYSDEDKTDAAASMYFEPHFKTDYNEELLNHYNYICHFLMFHRSLLSAAGGLNPELDGAQDYDFVLRCSEILKNTQIAHIKKIVYHWRVHDSSTAAFSGNKNYAYEAGIRAVQAHLDRVCSAEKEDGICKVRLTACAARGQEYVAVKKQVVTGGQQLLKGWTVCLSDGIKPQQPDWAEQLVLNACGKKTPVGMVGGKLVTPGRIFGRVRSAGYHVDGDGSLKPSFSGLFVWMRGYFGRAAVPQQVDACSPEFCVIQTSLLEAAGGLDKALSSSQGLKQFAARIRDAGYEILLDPQVVACQKKEKGDSGSDENIRCNGDL